MHAWMLSLLVASAQSPTIIDVDVIEVNQCGLSRVERHSDGLKVVTIEGSCYVNFRDFRDCCGESRYWVRDWALRKDVTIYWLEGRPHAVVKGLDRVIYIRGVHYWETFGCDTQHMDMTQWKDYRMPRIDGMRGELDYQKIKAETFLLTLTISRLLGSIIPPPRGGFFPPP